MVILGFDIGSNSVGSYWYDGGNSLHAAATSIFPAGVEESDDKRGDPKNAQRRAARRTRITLNRRAIRKRQLRLRLIRAGLLPADESGFKSLLETTDPWALRRRGLDQSLAPYEFGRVLLHLAQRRGAMGLKVQDADGTDHADQVEDGKVKEAIATVRLRLDTGGWTFGKFIANVRDERVHAITTEDRRSPTERIGPREYRDPIRNSAGRYEHCADRAMIREEFRRLWGKQADLGGPLAKILTDEFRQELDDDRGDSRWKHRGLLFGQRRQSWDLGTLGRCALEPTERCVPHADMHASRFLVVETLNNLKIIDRGQEARPLTPQERRRIKEYLGGPLGIIKTGKKKGLPKTSVSVSDLRELMGGYEDGWGKAGKASRFRFNIETDSDRLINTDWFNREIVHGVVTPQKWEAMSEAIREGLNRAILRYDPSDPADAVKLKKGAAAWAGLDEAQAHRLIQAWEKRPRPDAKRLKMSRRAVRNLLKLMDRDEPWDDPEHPGRSSWLTQSAARKLIAEDAEFVDVTTGTPMEPRARRRYATGAKGATARDRHYMRKHLLKKNGEPIYDDDGLPLREPPPPPPIANPVVRKAIYEVRRHLIDYMRTFGRKPDQVYVELSREARMGKKDADAALLRNRLRNRIRRDIAETFDLTHCSPSQRRVAEDRVILSVQQNGVCPLCGDQTVIKKITPRMAAAGEGCDLAHIIPRGCGGHNGFVNLVLAHTACNQQMARRTPRQFWEKSPGFEEGISRVEKLYHLTDCNEATDLAGASAEALWSRYFSRRDCEAKIGQFKKDVSDTRGMTNRQDAATKYAARQVMAYLADALFEGGGLPEYGGERRIFATDGLWTSRFRREWGLFFDPHHARAHGMNEGQEHLRKEKNRGDHRHHAVDAAVIACCSRQAQLQWDERELRAGQACINTADELAMESYRRQNPLPPPAPFQSRDEFRQAVHRAVFGGGQSEKPVCHRPVKRKLVGPLHKATQYGPVIDVWQRNGQIHRELVEGRVTKRQEILGEAAGDFLKPAHLREPRPESDDEAIARLARRMRLGQRGLAHDAAIKAARKLVKSNAYCRAMVDPKPEKGGIVRNLGLRRFLRRLLVNRGLNPDSYTRSELAQSIEKDGPLKHKSGVPIHRVVLLWSNNDPVAIPQVHFDYFSGRPQKSEDVSSLRLYDGQNNHHIEIRVASSEGAWEKWSGQVVTAFEAAQRKLARLRAFRNAGIPTLRQLRQLSRSERMKLKATLQQLEASHPLVDRRDNATKGGRFVMSLCEGETLMMRHKETGEVGYFVVAKLDKPQAIVLVPHWDARRAKGRKDADGNKVPDSQREDFTIVPSDLKAFAPPGRPHAIKVRVSPMGAVTELALD